MGLKSTSFEGALQQTCETKVTTRVFMPLFECPSIRCKVNKSKRNLILQLRASKFMKFQEVSEVSSLLGRAGTAGIGKAVEVLDTLGSSKTATLYCWCVTWKGGRVCSSCKTANYCSEKHQVAPGDIVEFSEIFLPIPYTGMRTGLVADTYLEAMSDTHFKRKIRVPHVNRSDYQLIDISEDGFVSLLSENGGTKDDLRLPTDCPLTLILLDSFEGDVDNFEGAIES